MLYELNLWKCDRRNKKRINSDPYLTMYKFYVVRGYPLPDLLESTFAEKVLLMNAMEEYLDALNGVNHG